MITETYKDQILGVISCYDRIPLYDNLVNYAIHSVKPENIATFWEKASPQLPGRRKFTEIEDIEKAINLTNFLSYKLESQNKKSL